MHEIILVVLGSKYSECAHNIPDISTSTPLPVWNLSGCQQCVYSISGVGTQIVIHYGNGWESGHCAAWLSHMLCQDFKTLSAKWWYAKYSCFSVDQAPVQRGVPFLEEM